MIVEKNGVTYDLTDETHMAAFMANGWSERGKPAPSSGLNSNEVQKEKPKRGKPETKADTLGGQDAPGVQLRGEAGVRLNGKKGK